MKDIYSPLEIDEEWDQRAPDMDGSEGGGTTVAVAPAQEAVMGVDTSTESNMGASTLSPDLAAEAPAATDAAPMAGDTIEPMGDMMADPAHDAAAVAVEQPQVMPVTETTTTNPGTLDISEMSSGEDHEPTHAVVEADDSEDGATPVLEGNKPEPMKVSVMGDTEADEADDNTVEAGATFNPVTFPGGKIPEPEAVKPEAKTGADDEEDAEEPVLPASPVVEKEEEDDAETEPAGEMDTTDKKFMAAIEEWNRAKERANEKLTTLLADVEADIDRTRAEITDLEAHVDAKEKEREDIQTQRDELGEIKPAA